MKAFQLSRFSGLSAQSRKRLQLSLPPPPLSLLFCVIKTPGDIVGSNTNETNGSYRRPAERREW